MIRHLWLLPIAIHEYECHVEFIPSRVVVASYTAAVRRDSRFMILCCAARLGVLEWQVMGLRVSHKLWVCQRAKSSIGTALGME